MLRCIELILFEFSPLNLTELLWQHQNQLAVVLVTLLECCEANQRSMGGEWRFSILEVTMKAPSNGPKNASLINRMSNARKGNSSCSHQRLCAKKTCALRNSLTIVPLHARLLRSTLTSRIARPGGRTYNIVHGARALLPVAPWEGERGHSAIQVPYNLNVSYGNTSCSKMPDIAIFANQKATFSMIANKLGKKATKNEKDRQKKSEAQKKKGGRTVRWEAGKFFRTSDEKFSIFG